MPGQSSSLATYFGFQISSFVSIRARQAIGHKLRPNFGFSNPILNHKIKRRIGEVWESVFQLFKLSLGVKPTSDIFYAGPLRGLSDSAHFPARLSERGSLVHHQAKRRLGSKIEPHFELLTPCENSGGWGAKSPGQFYQFSLGPNR